jgi:predicted Zn-dependent protease
MFGIEFRAGFRFAVGMNGPVVFRWARRWSGALVLLGLCVWGCGCHTVPLTGRSQFNLMSPQEELQLGLTSFAQLKQELPVSQDAAAKALVQRVGKKIAAAAGQDLPDAQWEFVVFQSEQANAFCLPGGKVGVYSGLLPITRTEAGLATVLGHEVAHAVARHGGERMSRAMVIQGGGSLLGWGLQSTDPEVQAASLLAYGVGGKLLGELPHSREQESEADLMGLIYMTQAGYPPEAAVEFWERFADFNRRQGGAEPWFLRTHPLDEQRIKQLQQWIPEVKQRVNAGR